MLPLISIKKNINNSDNLSYIKVKGYQITSMADIIGNYAVESLLIESNLTPKPGLVDADNSGIHTDMTLELMEKSAYSLKHCFIEIAKVGYVLPLGQTMRDVIAEIGRKGEQCMYQTTQGINTHKGAIWALGLIAAVVTNLIQTKSSLSVNKILKNIAFLTKFEDRNYIKPKTITHGEEVKAKYQIKNALDLAKEGFPILSAVAIPSYIKYKNSPKDIQLINVLLSIMSQLDDTCILYRSNLEVLHTIQKKAKAIIMQGGFETEQGKELYFQLDRYLMEKKVSPGGSADMLAATIFLQKICRKFIN